MSIDIDLIDCLNGIYKPLYEKTRLICEELKKREYIASYGWFNMHSIKHKDEFVTEYFPIPVIKVYNIGDIGIDMDSIFIELTLSKEASLNFVYTYIASKYSIEVYGVENYLTDIYSNNINNVNIADITSKIKKSNENQLHIGIYLDKNATLDEILTVIDTIPKID